MIGIPRISAPAIWGKLPDRGDYVRYRNHNNEIDDWRAWLDKQTWLHKTPTSSDKTSLDWLRLTPDFSHNISTLHTLPWSFVLNPGELAFSGKDWLIGVVSTSSDSVGRSYPLVIYQTVSQQWLKRYISVQKGWLFWLAQLVTNHVNVSDNSKKDLAETLDQLWDIHRPKLASWFDRAQINQQITCQQLIGQKEQEKLELSGVQSLPWANWPQLLWQPSQIAGWFWQQDQQGNFLDARCVTFFSKE